MAMVPGQECQGHLTGSRGVGGNQELEVFSPMTSWAASAGDS